MTRIVCIGVMAVTLSVMAPGRVAGHHSFAPFNMTTEKTISGSVKQVDWTNPHIWVWMDVPNDRGGVDTWGLEGMSPNYLARRGWTRTTLKVGDKVTVVIRPLKDGSNGGMFVSTKLANGKVLSMSGGSEN